MTGAASERPLEGPALAITAMALSLGTFMQVLDSTIANVSLPTIAGDLGSSSDNGTWIITAFAAANGVTVPLTGWLMRRFGLVRTFVTSVALFTIASLMCGLAWSLPSLILFRLIQGAVSGPMIPGSQALLIAVFPESKRSLALSIWSMTALAGPVAGPIMGGYISDHFHWGWIFLINVPVGVFAVFVTLRLLRGRDEPGERVPIDVMGIAMLVFWVGALQVVLDLGKNEDWFHSSTISVFAVLAAIGIVSWAIWEMTDRHPAVDLGLLRNRNFALGTVALSLGYALFFANNLLMPLWLQREEGYTATWAGLVAAPSGLMAIVFTPLVSRAAEKVDLRWLASFAFVGYGISYHMRAGFSAETDFWHFMAPMLIQGVAMSVFFMAMLTIALDDIPPEKVPSATGISNFARITGSSFGASIITTLWDRREALHQSRLAEAGTAFSGGYNDTLQHLNGFGLSDRAAAEVINNQIVNQAYLMASNDLFWISAIISFAMIALVWLARRPDPPSGPVLPE